MKTFRRQYKINLEEEEQLIKCMADLVKDEIFTNANTKAEEAIDQLMNLSGDMSDYDTVIVSWNVRVGIGNFKAMLGNMRRKKAGKK